MKKNMRAIRLMIMRKLSNKRIAILLLILAAIGCLVYGVRSVWNLIPPAVAEIVKNPDLQRLGGLTYVLSPDTAGFKESYPDADADLALDAAVDMLQRMQGRFGYVKTDKGYINRDIQNFFDAGIPIEGVEIDDFILDTPVSVTRSGENIALSLPGIINADRERFMALIFGKSNMKFQMVDDKSTQAFLNHYRTNFNDTFNSDGSLVDPSIIPSFTEVIPYKDSYVVALREGVVIDHSVIENIGIAQCSETETAIISAENKARGGDYYGISFELSELGKTAFKDYNEKNPAERVVLNLDGIALGVFEKEVMMLDDFILTGQWNETEAKTLMLPFYNVFYPMEYRIEDENFYFAGMGDVYRNIYKGLESYYGDGEVVLYK
jgi:hypothetical protein